MLGVVCDGMGGHAGGAEAAESALQAFLATHRSLVGEKDVKPNARLRLSLNAANDAVGERREQEGDAELADMGTTLTAFEMDLYSIRWISVGDSPLYLWAKNSQRLVPLNKLHNAPGYTNQLTSVLQGYRIPLIDEEQQGMTVLPGDWVIAASDGLDTLKKDSIQRAAMRASGQDGADLAAAPAGRGAPGREEEPGQHHGDRRAGGNSRSRRSPVTITGHRRPARTRVGRGSPIPTLPARRPPNATAGSRRRKPEREPCSTTCTTWRTGRDPPAKWRGRPVPPSESPRRSSTSASTSPAPGRSSRARP